jgi:uncharacterized membrane protein
MRTLRKALVISLFSILILAIGGAVYIIAAPHVGDKFTEFYILGLDGKADNYPKNLILGQESSVVAGIINREEKPTSYRLVIAINDAKNTELAPIILNNGAKWEEKVGFKPLQVGDRQKVTFLLYKDNESKPLPTTLRLWVNVSQ